MLDWLSSRVGMMFAAVVVTGSLIGFFMWQQNSFDEIQRQKSVDFIADHIDHVNSLSSNHRELMTFDKEKRDEGVYIGSMIGGETFTLTVTSHLVVMEQDGEEQVVSSLTRRVHPWNPEIIRSQEVVDVVYLDGLDSENRSLEIRPGKDFYVESLLLNMTTPYSSLEREYHTFVYLA